MKTRCWTEAVVITLKLIPKNTASYLTGKLVQIRFPSFLQKKLNLAFVKLFSINMSESAKESSKFSTIEDLFIRKLKSKARTWSDVDLCSPCDGYLSQSSILSSEGIKAKGLNYSPEELIHGKSTPIETPFKAHWGTTIYLAPDNYHRVHMPLNAHLESITHIPGKLWPVKPSFLKYIPQLFSQNERLVFKLRTKENDHIYLIMVGAFNVGRIVPTDHPTLISNDTILSECSEQAITTVQINKDKSKGEELGIFMLGSTVIMLFDKQSTLKYKPMQNQESEEIRLGMSLVENKK